MRVSAIICLMEKQVTLNAGDRHTIHGVLNTGEKESETLAVFVHGLTGHPNEHIFYNAARRFPKESIDTFRFALYTGEEGGRKLSECTISTHASDLNQVISHFRDTYKTIVVIGHSLGSPTILKSDTSKMDVIILWEPSYLANGRENREVKIDGEDKYLEEWGVEYVLSTEMIDEWEWFDGKNELDLVAKLNGTLQVIVAGEGVLKEGGRKYIEVAQDPKEFVEIEGATHCFDEEGVEDQLFEKSLTWIKKHA